MNIKAIACEVAHKELDVLLAGIEKMKLPYVI
jgi:hypothetical protein